MLFRSVRDLGLDGQKEKTGTPTMGGFIIIIATLFPVFLFAKLDNIYIILLIITTLWMGSIGFLDDYIKKIKNNKEGLKGKFKIIGQVGLGVIVGLTLFFNSDVTIKEKVPTSQIVKAENFDISQFNFLNFGSNLLKSFVSIVHPGVSSLG